MSEMGMVAEVSGNMISVKMSPLSSCGKCKACDARKRSDMTIKIENTCNASVGDYVSVDMEQTILAGSIIFYGIPLMAFMVGILLGLRVAPSFVSESWQEPVAATIGVLFLLLSYLCIRLADPLIKRRIRFPTATSIIPNDLKDEPGIGKGY